MKKIFNWLIPLSCLCAVFTACSDDDDSSSNAEKIAGTYAGATLGLHESGSSMAVANKSVEVKSASDGKATFILNNVFPDAESVEIQATLNGSSSDVSFSGTAQINNCSVGITGTCATNYLDINISRAFTGVYVNTWDLAYDTTNVAKMYLDVITGNTVVDALIPQIKSVLSSMVGSKITAMNITLKEDGFVGMQWTTADGKTTTIPDELQLRYCFRDTHICLAFDKALTDVAKLLLSSTLSKYNLTVDQITQMLTDADGDLGGYYAIPLSIKTDNVSTQVDFYMSKSLVVPLLTALQPLISQSIPSSYATMLSTFMALLPSSKTVDLGAAFNKK